MFLKPFNLSVFSSKRVSIWVKFYQDTFHNFHFVEVFPFSAMLKLGMFLVFLGRAGIELSNDLKEIGPATK